MQVTRLSVKFTLKTKLFSVVCVKCTTFAEDLSVNHTLLFIYLISSIMANVNLFTSNLQGKALVSEKSATKKAIVTVLANYEESINAEYSKVIKSKEQRVRNVANAAKGKFKTAIEVVANCYPYQTKDGKLARKGKDVDGNKVWKEKKLTAAAARGIVRDSLKHFTDTVGKPEITTVVIGSFIEK